MTNTEITLRGEIVGKMSNNVGFFSIGLHAEVLMDELKQSVQASELPDEEGFAELVRNTYPRYVESKVGEWPEIYDELPDFGEMEKIVSEVVVMIGGYNINQMMELVKGGKIDKS